MNFKERTLEEIEKENQYKIQCDKIRLLPLNTLEEIQNAKEKSRSIPDSFEKVILFKELITKENYLKSL